MGAEAEARTTFGQEQKRRLLQPPWSAFLMASLLAEVRAERKDSLKGAGWHRPPDHPQARLRVVAQMIRHPRQAARGQNRFGDRTMAGIAFQASDFRVFRFVHEAL